MFNINNCILCAAKISSSKGEELGYFTEVCEFILALRAMKAGMAFVMPWKMSMAALEGFAMNTRHCRDKIGHLKK
jgi:hypothetical protein